MPLPEIVFWNTFLILWSTHADKHKINEDKDRSIIVVYLKRKANTKVIEGMALVVAAAKVAVVLSIAT